jgi:pimeloyl-ACP methyl ester carboxylesterase
VPAVILLPGIIAPAAVRYGPLLEELGDVEAVLKDLEIHADAAPPQDYSIELEVAGIARAADRAGLARFHVLGHSGGGACALAFAAEHPDRVLSLALDEPATDFSAEDRAHPRHEQFAAARTLPPAEAIGEFLRLQLAPGVEPPPPPEGPPPPWMASRPAAVGIFEDAILRHRVDPARYEAIRVPVLFTYGGLTHPHWAEMCDRLARRFPDFEAVRSEGLSHVTPLHQADPERAALLLRAHWARADAAAA